MYTLELAKAFEYRQCGFGSPYKNLGFCTRGSVVVYTLELVKAFEYRQLGFGLEGLGFRICCIP